MPAQPLDLRARLLCIFVPFAVGYFISYLFRVMNAVIATDLASDLALGAGALGFLTSAYFLAFAAAQLPLGILLDRFGARRVESVLLLVAALGAALFAIGETLAVLGIGRALIGLGVSACLMASFKAFVQWFPAQTLPQLNGWLLAVGGLGAMAGTVPLEWLVAATDWRTVFAALAVACVGASVLLWRLVPVRPPDARSSAGRETPSLGRQIGELGQVLRHPWFWTVAPLGAINMGVFLALQGLWAGPWLRDVAGMDRPAIAMALLLIAAAMTAGYAFWGTVATRLSAVGGSVRNLALFGVALALVMLFILSWQPPRGMVLLWMLYAFAGSAGTLFYVVLTRSFPNRLAGRVNTAFNLLIFLSAFALQWALGLGLQQGSADGAGYDPLDYRIGFLMLCLITGLAMVWFLRGCRRYATTHQNRTESEFDA